MLRKNLLIVAVAALMIVPAASQASELSRRLTIRYPGQDARKHHHHEPKFHEVWRDHRHDDGHRPQERHRHHRR